MGGICIIFLYFLIAFIQPILLFTPEVATVTGGSLAFGPFKGFIIGYIGIILGIVVMYFIGRYGGEKLVNRFLKKDLLAKYSRYVNENGIMVIGALFILPILPDNIICLGAGLTKISFKTFIIIASFSKLLTTFVYSYSLELARLVSLNKYQLIMVQVGIIAVIVLINYIVKQYKFRTA